MSTATNPAGHRQVGRYSSRMPFALVNEGVYDPIDVAHLLGLKRVEQVLKWALPDARGNPAAVTPTHGRAYSFADLVSLAVIGQLARRHVSSIDVRRGIDRLRASTGQARPLAVHEVQQRLATSGRSFIEWTDSGWNDLGRGGQGAFDEVVRLSLRWLEFDGSGHAAILRPWRAVVLDRRIQAGAPCIEGTRITTATIAALAHDDTPAEIASEYGVAVEAVEAAVEFERRLDDGIGIAA